MPFHPVTAALMYRGIYTVPNLLSEQRPVDIPEDELEGECVARPADPPAPPRIPGTRGSGAPGKRGPLRCGNLPGPAAGSRGPRSQSAAAVRQRRGPARVRASGPRAPRAPAPRSPPPRGSPRSHWHSARVARAANPIWSGRPGKGEERVTGRWGLADSAGPSVPSARPPDPSPQPRGDPHTHPSPSERLEGKTAPGAGWRQQVAGLGGFGGDDPAWKGETERPDRRSPPSPPGRPYLSGRTGN